MTDCDMQGMSIDTITSIHGNKKINEISSLFIVLSIKGKVFTFDFSAIPYALQEATQRRK